MDPDFGDTDTKMLHGEVTADHPLLKGQIHQRGKVKTDTAGTLAPRPRRSARQKLDPAPPSALLPPTDSDMRQEIEQGEEAVEKDQEDEAMQEDEEQDEQETEKDAAMDDGDKSSKRSRTPHSSPSSSGRTPANDSEMKAGDQSSEKSPSPSSSPSPLGRRLRNRAGYSQVAGIKPVLSYANQTSASRSYRRKSGRKVLSESLVSNTDKDDSDQSSDPALTAQEALSHI